MPKGLEKWFTNILGWACGTAVFLTVAALFMFGPTIFTSSGRAQLFAWGGSCHVQLFNGGKLVGEWDSVGKVREESGSDGWYFEDAKTGKLVRMSGTVVVTINK